MKEEFIARIRRESAPIIEAENKGKASLSEAMAETQRLAEEKHAVWERVQPGQYLREIQKACGMGKIDTTSWIHFAGYVPTAILMDLPLPANFKEPKPQRYYNKVYSGAEIGIEIGVSKGKAMVSVLGERKHIITIDPNSDDFREEIEKALETAWDNRVWTYEESSD